MSDHSEYDVNLHRGQLLCDQNRYAEAEKYFQQAISGDRSSAEGYYELAFCYSNWTDHNAKALQTIDHAISIDPNRGDFFSLRAWVLDNLKRHKESVQVAEEALAFNPDSMLALNAKTRALIHLRDLEKAEANARLSLALSPTNELAANLLAISLNLQGKLHESNTVTASLLAQGPDNAMSHCNAGWSALQTGDHRLANQCFLAALRLDPNYENARLGLLDSFSSRVWIYRVYFQFIAWLGKHRKGMRYFFLAVIYIAYRLVITGLRKEFGNQSFYWIFVVMALYFIIFGFGRSFGNFFLLLDPCARHALTPKEKRRSIFVGTFYGFILGIEILGGAWPQAAILLAVLAFFLWGVLFPRFQDALSRRSSAEAIMD